MARSIRDRAATVPLAGAMGRNRIVLKVEAEGVADIDFLDAGGNVVISMGRDGR